MRECTVHSLPSFARHSGRALLFTAATLLLAATLTPTPAFADGTDGISGTPASESGADQRSRFSYEAAPGQSLSDNYLLSNTGTTAQTLRVFATDAFNTEDGAYGLLDTTAVPTDAGSWVTFGGAAFVDVPLAAGASQLVTFTMTVPADAAPGDHAAGIVISATSSQGQILVDRRVATRLYVRVPGDLQPALTVSSFSASYDATVNPLAGDTTITFTVANKGNVALGATMVIGVNTFFGIGATTPIRQELSEMLPRSTRVISVTVPGVPQLGYLNPYVQLAPTVADDAMNPGALTTVNRDAVTIAVPWWLVVILIVGGAVYAIVRVRRRIDTARAEEWVAHMEAEARKKAEDEATDRQLVAASDSSNGGQK